MLDDIGFFSFLRCHKQSLISSATILETFFDTVDRKFRQSGMRLRLRSVEAPNHPIQYDFQVKTASDEVNAFLPIDAAAGILNDPATLLSVLPKSLLAKIGDECEVVSCGTISVERSYFGIGETLVKVDSCTSQDGEMMFTAAVVANDYELGRKVAESALADMKCGFVVGRGTRFSQMIKSA